MAATRIVRAGMDHLVAAERFGALAPVRADVERITSSRPSHGILRSRQPDRPGRRIAEVSLPERCHEVAAAL